MNSIVRMGHVYEWFLRIGHLGREFRVEISCRHPFLVFAWQHDHVDDGAVGHKHCCGSSVGYLGGLICFLKASSAERAYIAPKNHSSPRRGQPAIIPSRLSSQPLLSVFRSGCHRNPFYVHQWEAPSPGNHVKVSPWICRGSRLRAP